MIIVIKRTGSVVDPIIHNPDKAMLKYAEEFLRTLADSQARGFKWQEIAIFSSAYTFLVQMVIRMA